MIKILPAVDVVTSPSPSPQSVSPQKNLPVEKR